jgi:non-canonical (house-cleaning) NTP pyrophosphatase
MTHHEEQTTIGRAGVPVRVTTSRQPAATVRVNVATVRATRAVKTSDARYSIEALLLRATFVATPLRHRRADQARAVIGLAYPRRSARSSRSRS